MKKITIRKLLFAFLTFISTTGIGIIGLYYTPLFQKDSLSYEITTNSSVLDVHTDLSSLDISYNGESIKKNSQKLRIVYIRIVNDGSGNIYKNYYDENDLPGLAINNGILAEKPEVIDSSTAYIKKHISINQKDNNSLIFNPIIIDKGDFFTLKLLILHSNSTLPDIISIGKVAGIKEIKVVDKSNIEKNSSVYSFLTNVFQGSLLIQFIRLLIYGIFAIILGFITLVIISLISDMRSKKIKSQRQKLLDEFEVKHGGDIGKDEIFKDFVNNGSEHLAEAMNYIRNNQQLNDEYRKHNNKQKKTDKENEDWDIPAFLRNNEIDIVNSLIKKGYIIKEHETLIINDEKAKVLKDFEKFLIEKKKLTNIEDS
jgi:hypothetical protein